MGAVKGWLALLALAASGCCGQVIDVGPSCKPGELEVAIGTGEEPFAPAADFDAVQVYVDSSKKSATGSPRLMLLISVRARCVGPRGAAVTAFGPANGCFDVLNAEENPADSYGLVPTTQLRPSTSEPGAFEASRVRVTLRYMENFGPNCAGKPAMISAAVTDPDGPTGYARRRLIPSATVKDPP